MKTISFEQFKKYYKLQQNPFTENGSYDNCAFETYDPELTFVKQFDNNRIWTLLSCDNEESWIIPGYHFVNRQNYFVTEIPWEDENIEVDDNEYLTREECIKICFSFWKENGFEFDLNQIKNFYEKESYTVGEAKYIAMDVYIQITGQDELSSEQQDNINDYYSNL